MSKKEERMKLIRARHLDMLAFDKSYAKTVIGIDEVGRGPLFGCVLSAACHINPTEDLIEVYDSKKLSEKKRESLFDKIIENANSYGIGIAEVKTIDELGIQKAISMAMKEALDKCYAKASYSDSLILADYISFDIENYEYTPIKKGDTKSFQIACASIIAKVTRDRMIKELDAIYPEYDLKNNKGYGTKKHIEALKKYGATEEHRMSFLQRILNESSR